MVYPSPPRNSTQPAHPHRAPGSPRPPRLFRGPPPPGRPPPLGGGPPPPGRPPPPSRSRKGDRSLRGRASLTTSARPLYSLPFIAVMASADFSTGTSTNPNPREAMSRVSATGPHGSNKVRRSCSVTSYGRFPTYRLLDAIGDSSRCVMPDD